MKVSARSFKALSSVASSSVVPSGDDTAVDVQEILLHVVPACLSVGGHVGIGLDGSGKGQTSNGCHKKSEKHKVLHMRFRYDYISEGNLIDLKWNPKYLNIFFVEQLWLD